ncbi:GntR family transcriptional regulator [Streptomyces anthocyanicus]|uniref:GntR family transcriptional regulator n=1 Tax=Streptomyces anthocyanicus TaxID=68174 RepID=UPI00381C1D7C
MTAEPQLEALERPESLADRAYHALREQIATGGLPPGGKVTERGLAVRLGISATPVREALRRLEQERLVERVSPRQMRVSAYSEEALGELMYTEAVIRAAAARIATAKIDDATLDTMEALVDELGRDPAGADPARQLVLARRFDDLLLDAAGNPVIASVVDTVSVFGWAARLRAVRAMHDDEPEVGLSRLRGHRELLDALRARDADLVESLARRQIVEAADYFRAHGEGRPTTEGRTP